MPCLPRKTKVGTSKCHPRLPRKTTVNVAECHACHVKRKWMSPSATPATQSTAPSPATNPGPSAPKRAAKCNKCHTCHVKRTWVSPGATPATQSNAASPATKRAQARHQVQQVPRLPRKTKVDATKCHARHAKLRWVSPSATPATQNEGECRRVPRPPRETEMGVTGCHACHAK